MATASRPQVELPGKDQPKNPVPVPMPVFRGSTGSRVRQVYDVVAPRRSTTSLLNHEQVYLLMSWCFDPP